MLRVPSRRKNKSKVERLNLVPILDSVFIFIFFLLTSANFIKIFEIPSDIPIVSNEEPPKNEKPLALTLKISLSKVEIFTGSPARLLKSFSVDPDGSYLENIKLEMIALKKRNLKEKTAIFEPDDSLDYEMIVKIMDAVRVIRNTDETIFIKNDKGQDEKLNVLFDNIIFSNLRS
jgi:biopolymer transport protein ExbD